MDCQESFSTVTYLSLILTSSSLSKQLGSLLPCRFLTKAQISSTQFEKWESFQRDISLAEVKNRENTFFVGKKIQHCYYFLFFK